MNNYFYSFILPFRPQCSSLVLRIFNSFLQSQQLLRKKLCLLPCLIIWMLKLFKTEDKTISSICINLRFFFSDIQNDRTISRNFFNATWFAFTIHSSKNVWVKFCPCHLNLVSKHSWLKPWLSNRYRHFCSISETKISIHFSSFLIFFFLFYSILPSSLE